MSDPGSIVGRLLDDRYKVSRRFGEGGMGAVFLAEDERLKKQVVVKIPLPGMVVTEASLARFDLEIDFLIQLDHPRIVKVLDKGTVDGVPYVVLQYLSGGSLMDSLSKQGGHMTPEQVHKWLDSVASATDFIHSKNRIHRDIKPANILFDGEGNAFLADFGIAKALDEPGVTKTGTIPGSPAYMGPECLKAQFAAPYDQYALATVVYQCLAGHLPYHDEDPGSLLFAKNSKDPQSLDDVDAGPFSRGIADCVARALDRDPAKRHPTCLEFARRFEGCLFRGAPLDDDQPTATMHTASVPRWPRRLLLGGLIGIVVAVLFLVWYAGQQSAPVDVQVTTVPPGAAVTLADGTAVTSGLLSGLQSPQRISVSMPGYETFTHELDPSDGPEQSFDLVADCSGASSSGSPYPVRLLFSGLDAPTQRRILDSFAFTGAVGSGCDYDALVRGGPDAAIDDADNRPLSPLRRDGSDLPAALGDPLARLYLERTLRGPGDGAGTLELVFSNSSDVNAPSDPVFRDGDSAWTRVRSTDKPHLLVLSVQSDGGLAVLYPQDPQLAEDGISTGDWFAVQQTTMAPPFGRETLMAFVSGRSWASLLDQLPTTTSVSIDATGSVVGAIPILDDQSTFTARNMAEAVSDYLASSTDWAADSYTYLIEGSSAGD